MPPRPDDSLASDGAEPESSLLHFGGIVGAGVLGAAMAAAPSAVRFEGGSGVCGKLGDWAVMCGAAVLPMTIAVVALRRARTGLQPLDRRDGATSLTATLFWLVSLIAALAALGAAFRSHTHHRALGGVVFAIAAAGLATGLAVGFVRVASLSRRAPPATRWALVGLGVAALSLTAAWARQRVPTGDASIVSRHEAAKLVDGLAFALSALVASSHSLARRRILSLLGPPLAASVIILGISIGRACPAVFQSLDRSPWVTLFVGRPGPD